MTSMCVSLSDGSAILVDCAEGTQQQFLRSSLKPSHVSCICITHLHGDHCYGLFGFLHTLSQQTIEMHENNEEEHTMTVIGPKGIKELLVTVFRLSGGFPFGRGLKIIELEGKEARFVMEHKGIQISAVWLEHRVPTYGYIFEESTKPGALDGKKAKQLGAVGKQMGILKSGQDRDIGKRYRDKKC
eukprot:UN34680